MIVNTNELRLRLKDGNVIWVKRGDKIKIDQIPEPILKRLIATDRIVEKMVEPSKNKLAPTSKNKGEKQ